MLAAVAAAAVSRCHQAIFTAPPGSTLVLVANPTFIPANGGVSVITAVLTEPAGTPVADGTVVQFFTTLGHIDEQGKTNDGVARVNLVSDARSGTATVTGVSGGQAAAPSSPSPSATPSASPTPSPSPSTPTGGVAQGTVTVIIGSALPRRVIVTAQPNRITDSRSTHVVANVFDERGNPVANVPVIFTVDQGAPTPVPSATPTPSPTPTPTPTPTPSVAPPASTERMESGGAPIFTDNNGRAEDVLRTQYPRDAAPKTVTVRATTSNGVQGSVSVVIN